MALCCKWFKGVSGYADAVKKSDNLADIADSSEARDNLGVYSKEDLDNGGNFQKIKMKIEGTNTFGTLVLKKKNGILTISPTEEQS